MTAFSTPAHTSSVSIIRRYGLRICLAVAAMLLATLGAGSPVQAQRSYHLVSPGWEQTLSLTSDSHSFLSAASSPRDIVDLLREWCPFAPARGEGSCRWVSTTLDLATTNGDQVELEMEGYRGHFQGARFYVAGMFTVVGGTGQFAHASGHGYIAIDETPQNEMYYLIDGTILP